MSNWQISWRCLTQRSLLCAGVRPMVVFLHSPIQSSGIPRKITMHSTLILCHKMNQMRRDWICTGSCFDDRREQPETWGQLSEMRFNATSSRIASPGSLVVITGYIFVVLTRSWARFRATHATALKRKRRSCCIFLHPPPYTCRTGGRLDCIRPCST